MFKSSGGGSGPRGGDLNGFLDAGSEIIGELRFEDTFRIEGHLDGKINAKGELVVGENGTVDADVSARRVYVAGTLTGSVTAHEALELAATARVRAKIQTPSLSIEPGAFFEGSSEMPDHPEAKKPQDDNVTALSAAKKQERAG
ncbi:MAG: polymer-forming cytoskeletal protein [Acidobacteriota bacterium]